MIFTDETKTLANLAFWVTLGLAAGLLWQGGSKVHAFQATSPVTPYTVTLSNVVKPGDGSIVHSSNLTTAVRSDGARVMRKVRLVGPRVDGRVIALADGTHVLVDDVNQVRSSTFDSNRTPEAWYRDPGGRCLGSVDGRALAPGQQDEGTEYISGFRSAKVRIGNVTSWFAIDHGCAMVKSRAVWKDGGVTEQELLSLIGGNPDPSHFEIPGAYREVTPSELHELASQGRLNGDVAKAMAKQDQWYRNHRPPSGEANGL